jgi:hypothetical protein
VSQVEYAPVIPTTVGMEEWQERPVLWAIYGSEVLEPLMDDDFVELYRTQRTPDGKGMNDFAHALRTYSEATEHPVYKKFAIVITDAIKAMAAGQYGAEYGLHTALSRADALIISDLFVQQRRVLENDTVGTITADYIDEILGRVSHEMLEFFDYHLGFEGSRRVSEGRVVSNRTQSAAKALHELIFRM